MTSKFVAGNGTFERISTVFFYIYPEFNPYSLFRQAGNLFIRKFAAGWPGNVDKAKFRLIMIITARILSEEMHRSEV